MSKYNVTIHLEDGNVTYVRVGLIKALYELYVGVTAPTKVSIERQL